MRCPKCNNKISELDDKCKFCGINLDEFEIKNKEEQDIQEEKEKVISMTTIMSAIIVIFLVCGMFAICMDRISSTKTENTVKNEINKLPDNIEIMSYAQTVLKDNLSNPKYSSFKEDYNIIKTDLRYKIEGNVTINYSTEKFWMIIEFTDSTYKEYDLISLQVGNKNIYKK